MIDSRDLFVKRREIKEDDMLEPTKFERGSFRKGLLSVFPRDEWTVGRRGRGEMGEGREEKKEEKRGEERDILASLRVCTNILHYRLPMFNPDNLPNLPSIVSISE